MAQISRRVVWHGTEREEQELVAAVEQHCGCGSPDDTDGPCSAHQLLIANQATLDRLLFARFIADQLRREEGLPIERRRRGRAARAS
jgi:hypothetical protein